MVERVVGGQRIEEIGRLVRGDAGVGTREVLYIFIHIYLVRLAVSG